MGPTFQFAIADRILADTITVDLESGRSTVILGSPGSGKFIIFRRIRTTLRADKAGPIVDVNFQREPALSTLESVRAIITESARAVGARPTEAGDTLLGSLDGFDSCVFLLLENVDSLGHHLIRQVLTELRERAEAKRVVTLIAGEYDLRDFVYGPVSEATSFVSRQYVLQGCDFESFDEFLRDYFRTVNAPLPSEASRRDIWTLTGGNAEIAISVIEAVVKMFRRTDLEFERREFDAAALVRVLAHGVTYSIPDSYLLRHAIRLIPLEPDVWNNLRLLVKGECPSLRQPPSRPAALTLSGLVKRRDGKLEFASKVMELAACRFFDDRYFGDLYAQAGRWEEAFNLFEKLTAEERLRPVVGSDRGPAQETVRAAKTRLQRDSLDSSRMVRERFEKVTKLVLGFPEVAFWERAGDWQLMDNRAISEACRRASLESCRLAETIALENKVPNKEVAIPAGWVGKGFAWKLKGEGGREIAVLIGDFVGNRLVSPERERLARDLIGAFLDAHCQATASESRRRRRQFRVTQGEIVKEVLRKLGVEIIDVEDILLRAQEHLQKQLEYRRIAFTLVDPAGEKIERVLEDTGFGIKPMSWLLSEPGSGVPPYVAHTKQTLCVSDAAKHPLADRVLPELGVIAFAVAPIAGDGQVTGTVYFERADKRPPSNDEVEDFEAFGAVLYFLLAQARRVSLLQKSLDATPDPHIIIDAKQRLRYVNRRAGSLLDLDSQWRSETAAESEIEMDRTKLAPVWSDIQVALGGVRVGHHDARFERDPTFHGSLTAEKIENRRGQTTGAFIHVEDTTYVDKILKALARVASAQNSASALEGVIEALQILGHQWARIYLISAHDPNLRESHAQFGFKPGGDAAMRFESQGFRFQRGMDEGIHGWTAIAEGVPIVFRYMAHTKRLKTANGLEYRCTDRPCLPPLHKLEGSYWLEAPLTDGQTTLGNISVACDENLRPEEFHFLKGFFDFVANLLAVNQTHERASKELARAKDDAHRVSLALLSHNLGTRIAGLRPLISLYEDLELAGGEQLADLNRLFRVGYEDMAKVLSKAKVAFQNAPLQLQRGEVFAMLDRVIGDSLAGEAHRVTGLRPLEADFDPVQMTSAIKEVVHNAIDFAPKESIAIDVQTYGTGALEFVKMIISDAGPGVAPEIKAKIFDDFFTHRPGQNPGSGLGLALVRRVVESHGGRVYEDGEPAGGAQIVLEFPRFGAGRNCDT